MSNVQMKDIMEKFYLELVAGKDGLEREITTSDISRPGIEMAGYFTHYAPERIQLLGRTELSFVNELPSEVRMERFNQLCQKETPGIILTRENEAPKELILAAQASGVPIFRSALKTTKLSSQLTNYLEGMMAPSTTKHGVLVEIYGIGVLITGASGVGKSETALELVKRGHRLIADDAVNIRQEDYETLVGSAPDMIRHLLEIRGLGIINVMALFGAGAVRSHKKISLVIHLEAWEPQKLYDRLGIEDEKIKIIDTYVTKTTVPVRPGRNLAVITEVAAMNFRMKMMGVNAAEQFSTRLTSEIEKDK
ncbi:HPr kinase/phosphorylase [Lottiidibacillus patelloidae]|uniref:HPr kinase/phosphorylase n=1 Tax=Lottiidibacillus patelloidae TaxID=2670334 RepID=A0A263BSJ2_9BACI|nr:HPr(Ser) kinase/phosphatase [Lottiidibacillus patelloidae]OZM56542.1 HPr kinase/phosphorylase [Lottiidibacillus patelloidae]